MKNINNKLDNNQGIDIHYLNRSVLALHDKLDELIKKHEEYSRNIPRLEKDYRQKLAKQILIETNVNKRPQTNARTIADGNEDVATAKLKWQVAENLRDSNQQAIYSVKGKISTLKEMIKWDRGL